MNTSRNLLKQSFFNGVGYVYLVVVSLISYPLFIRFSGAALFGFYLTLTGIIGLFVTLDYGLSKSLIYSLSSHKPGSVIWNNRVQAGLSLSLLLGLINALVAFVFFRYYLFGLGSFSVFTQESFWIAVLPAAIILVYLQNQTLLSLFQSQQQFAAYNLVLMAMGTSNTLISAFIFGSSHSLTSVFVFQLSFQTLTLCTLLVIYRLLHRHLYMPQVIPKVWFSLLKYGLKQFVGVVASQLDFHTSRILIATFLNSTLVTVFSLPQTLVLKASGGVSQLSLSLLPFSVKNQKTGTKKVYRTVLFSLGASFFLGLSAVTVIWLFADALLTLWLGDNALASAVAPVLRLLSLFLFLNVLTPVPTVIFESWGLPHIPSLSAIATVSLNLVFLWIFIPRFGVLGATYSLLMSSLITVPIYLLVFFYHLNKRRG